MTGDEPDFGPRGYLPDRASRRARKIVLRAPMGMQWVWGAIATGVGVCIVGAIFLLTAGGPPGAPFVELGPVTSLQDGPLANPRHPGEDLLATTSGRLRIFHVPAGVGPLAWCEASRQFEGPSGIFSATGRSRGGAASLDEHPAIIVDGIVYWDPEHRLEGPLPETSSVAAPAC